MDDFGYNKDMADTPEIIPPMTPGIDHPKYPVPMRQVVAENAGVDLTAVTPSNEVADNMVDDARTSFLQSVAGVGQPLDKASSPQEADFSGGLKETLDAYNPWGDDDSTRTAPSKEPFDLEAARNEKMKPVEEAA